MTHLTTRQRAVLGYMRQFLCEQDQMPTLDAMAKAFGWASSNAAFCICKQLERKGVIERNALGGWRFTRGPAPVYGQAQYLEDLETLERIEDQNYCFFDSMGELAAQRAGCGA